MIILSTGCLYKLSLEKIFEIASKAGLDGIELMQDKNDPFIKDYFNAKLINSLKTKYNLQTPTIHPAPSLDIDYTPYYKNSIKLAREINAQNIIIHIPKKTRPHYIKWFNNFYLKNLNHDSVTFLTENMGAEAIYNDVENLKKFPNLCFDIAHSMASGQDTIKMIDSLKNIREFHISNYNGEACHTNFMLNKKPFEKILSKHKKPLKCTEAWMGNFVDVDNDNKVIEKLKDMKMFLEKFE